MRGIPFEVALIAIAFFVILEFLIVRASLKYKPSGKRITKTLVVYAFFSLITYTPFILYLIPDFIKSLNSFTPIIYLNTILFSVIITKLVLVLIILVSFLFSLFKRAILASRLWYAGLFLSSIIFIYFISAITFGKYHTNYNNVTISFTDLPKEFDGLKIVHFTDFHAGSFLNDVNWLHKISKNVNSQHPDLILFTGDFVNNFSKELPLYKSFFDRLDSRYGKFSILGNHDYGDYSTWVTNAAKKEDHQTLISLQDSIGFKLLLNESKQLTINGKQLGIIGVENWGNPPFPRYGDLNKALENSINNHFNILLTHDPNHWKAEVVKNTSIPLALSGHTHGMQWGINIGGYTFSLSALLFPEWGGLYQSENQYLYVNVGLGEVGFPGRLDMRPEITLITIKQKS
ncbi:metallophosphoesterase [Prolixibacteraceae bacterium JC049]|nr:metallophosphoesterase [Prolixibacteraceae bacterium JC049]